MNKKNILFSFILLILGLLFINIFIITPEAKLLSEAKKIQKTILQLEDINLNKEVLIKKTFTLNNKEYKSKGEGVIFLENNYSFFLEIDDMCAVKLPYEEDIMIQKEPCPKYKMFAGIKNHVINEGSGLYEEKKSYIFKGSNCNNYVLLDNILYQILEFDSKEMTLVTTNAYSKSKELLSEEKYKETIIDSSYIDYNKKQYIKKINNNYINILGTGTKTDPYILLSNEEE